MLFRTPLIDYDYQTLKAHVLNRHLFDRRRATVTVSGSLSGSGEMTAFLVAQEQLELSWTSDQDKKEHLLFLLHSAWETVRIGDTFIFNHINESDADEPSAPKDARQIVIVLHP